jgi:hypothetical protein
MARPAYLQIVAAVAIVCSLRHACPRFPCLADLRVEQQFRCKWVSLCVLCLFLLQQPAWGLICVADGPLCLVTSGAGCAGAMPQDCCGCRGTARVVHSLRFSRLAGWLQRRRVVCSRPSASAQVPPGPCRAGPPAPAHLAENLHCP